MSGLRWRMAWGFYVESLGGKCSVTRSQKKLYNKCCQLYSRRGRDILTLFQTTPRNRYANINKRWSLRELASFRLVAVVTLLSKIFCSQVLPATIWQSVRAPGRHWLCPKRCFFSNLVEWVGKRIHMHSSSFLSFNDAMLRPNIIISNALLSALESMHLGYFVVIVHRSSRSVTLTQVQDVGVKPSTFCKGWKEEVWASSLPAMGTTNELHEEKSCWSFAVRFWAGLFEV